MNELIRLLQDYLTSSTSLAECAEWLAGVDWNDPELTEYEREAFGLFVTEISEGLREENDLREEAARFIADQSSLVFG